MKKGLILTLCGLMLSLAACSEETCNTPALYTQSKNLYSAVTGSADCLTQAEAINEYVTANKTDLDEAVTKWADDKQENGFCYVRDAALYVITYKNIKTVYTTLEACTHEVDENVSSQANVALTGLTSIQGWSAMYATALEEAEKSAETN